MGRKLDHVTFRRPGFKLVMARNEVRMDNGDLEVPPCVYKRVPGGWERLSWDALPDSPSILGLMKLLKQRRNSHMPKWRNPIGETAAIRMSLDSVSDYIAVKTSKVGEFLDTSG